MLLPHCVIDAVSDFYTTAGDVLGVDPSDLPDAAAYPVSWLIGALFLLLCALVVCVFVLYPMGRGLSSLAWSINYRPAPSITLDSRLARARTAKKVNDVAGWCIRHSGVRFAFAPDGDSHLPTDGRPAWRRIAGLIFAGSWHLGRFISSLAIAALRPAWHNVLLWSAVVVYLNPRFVADTSWAELWRMKPSVNVTTAQMVALIGLLYQLLGTTISGLSKARGKYLESVDTQTRTFLSSSIEPISELEREIILGMREAPQELRTILSEEIREATADMFTLSHEWDVESPWSSTIVRHHRVAADRGSGHAIRKLSERYSELEASGAHRHLRRSMPHRFRNLFYRFDSTLTHWALPLRTLDPERMRAQLREEIDLRVIRNDAELWLEEHGNGAPSSSLEIRGWVQNFVQKAVDGLELDLASAAEVLVEMESLRVYAARQTTAGVVERWVLNR